jgi:anthranilate phosphoribosyltransferase
MAERLSRLLDGLIEGRDLTAEEAGELLAALTEPATPGPLAGALLAALRAKGETAEEIRGLADAMRGLARDPGIGDTAGLTDVVGTGGDGSGSLNLSTGAALLAAACGVPIVKHGNRAVSSKSGSADTLEELGLCLPLDEAGARRCLEETGFTFLFAPYYHPAMKTVAQVRGAMGVRTVFNILGPLTNPARPPYSLIGAFSPAMAELMAESLAGTNLTRAFVVHGEPGWDEATPCGPYLLFDVRPGSVTRHERDPAELGLPRCAPGDLAGGDCQQNAAHLRAVLRGEEGGAHRDALLLGAALVLELTGRSPSAADGLVTAAEAIDGGAAAALLDRIAAFGQAAEV